MDKHRPIEPEIARTATSALLSALSDLLETATDAVAAPTAHTDADQIGELCQDANVLCQALMVIHRRAEP